MQAQSPTPLQTQARQPPIRGNGTSVGRVWGWDEERFRALSAHQTDDSPMELPSGEHWACVQLPVPSCKWLDPLPDSATQQFCLRPYCPIKM